MLLAPAHAAAPLGLPLTTEIGLFSKLGPTGGISLVVAMLFVWATIGMAVQTAHMQHQVDGFSGWEKAAQEWTCVALQNQNQIEASQISAGMCFLGALMTGGLGVVLIGKKAGTKP